MRSGLQRVWSSVVIGCFTAFAFLVLSYSPATLSATGSGDCVVSPEAQEEGLCCDCNDEGHPYFCNKVPLAAGYDRCQLSPTWCPDQMNCDGSPD